jgi:hypothetical protein
VTSGATACGCAPATVDSIMTTREVAMQKIREIIGTS